MPILAAASKLGDAKAAALDEDEDPVEVEVALNRGGGAKELDVVGVFAADVVGELPDKEESDPAPPDTAKTNFHNTATYLSAVNW